MNPAEFLRADQRKRFDCANNHSLSQLFETQELDRLGLLYCWNFTGSCSNSPAPEMTLRESARSG
jgi:hypothetical protein